MQTPQTGTKRITYSMEKMMQKKKIQQMKNTKTSKHKCKKKIVMQNPQTGITSWCKFGKEGVLKSKSLRKQTCFKIQFYVGIHLTWKVFGPIFSVLDFIPVVFFGVLG